MKKSDKSRFAILGMLLREPLSGYEIRKIMLNYTIHFWQESDASIYPMLKKLETEGKVKSRSQYVGERESRIFEITPAGKKEFANWIEIPAEEEKHRNELLLMLFFGANSNKEKILKQLFIRLQKEKEKKKNFENIKTSFLSKISDKDRNKLFWMMTLENGIISTNADIKWLQECINILQKNKLASNKTKKEKKRK